MENLFCSLDLYRTLEHSLHLYRTCSNVGRG